jgi:hypothetical protein
MAVRRLRGDNISSIVRASVRKRDKWSVSSVTTRLLRNPPLAGVILYDPDSGRRGRMTDVLRQPDGRPVIRKELAVITPTQRTTLIELLDVTR